MANAVVGALRVILSMDTAEFDAASKRVSASAKAWSTDLGNIGRQATAVGSALTKTLSLPILGLGIAAVKAASDFESSFAGVRKTIDGIADSSGKLNASGLQIQQGLRDMAKEIPIGVNGLNLVAEAAGQLGIKKEDILQFTRVMADLSVSTNLTADEAAVAIGHIQNIFGTAGKDVDRFGATLVALGNDGASTEKEIVDMATRISGAGHQIGLTQAQVLSIASALASVGINAEAGGSAISRVFLKINNAVMTGGKGLAEFARVSGMTAAQFKQAWQTDAASATTAFISGLARIKKEGENVNATMEGLVGKNIIIKDTLLRASGAGDLLTHTLALGNKAWQENTALTTEASIRYGTFENQLKKLWNQVNDVAITLGQQLLPILKDLIMVVTPMVGLLGELAVWFGKLPEPIRLAAVGSLALLAAIGPMIWAFGQLATAAGTVIGAFTSKGIIMRALNADYGALALSVRGLAATYWPLAASIAAVWAAWKIGNTETVKNSVAEWGLASENLTARLYRTLAGIEKMTPEQAKAAVAATAAAQASQAQAQANNELTKQLGAVVPVQQQAVTGDTARALSAKEVAKQVKEQAKEEKARMDALKAASKLEEKIVSENIAFRDKAVAEIDKEKAAQREYDNWLGERRMEDDARKLPIASTMDLSKMLAPLKGSVKEAGREWADFGQSVTESLSGLSNAFSQLSQISGGSLSETSRWLGTVVGSMNLATKASQSLHQGFSQLGSGFKNTVEGFSQLAAGAVAAASAIMAATNSTSKAKNVMGGIASGAQAGAAFGPYGMAVGAVVGGIIGAFRKTNQEIVAANAEIEKVRQSLIATYGPLDQLEAKANAVGLSFSENWGHQGKAGLEAFNALVTEFQKRWDALQQSLKDTQVEFDGLIGKAKDLGYEFDQSGKFVGVNFDKLKEKAEKFGISVDGLGPKFRQQGIDAEAQGIIDAFTLLDKAGGDTGGILVGLKDEIGALVAKSITLGTTIPANMKPWIDELARTHQLTDENGNELTDLSKLKFGEPVKTEFEKISSAILELITHINDLIAAIAAIPTDKTLTVTTQTKDGGGSQPQDGGVVGPSDGTSHGEGDGGGFSTGTLGRLGKWFGNFPDMGMATTLHGMEAVVTPSQAVPFAMDVLGSGANAGGSSSQSAQQPVVVHSTIENRLFVDGNEMKQWILDTITSAIDNNERGIRSRQRDALGVTT